MRKSDCIVIIPAKNEEKHLPEVIQGVWKYLNPAEILVINDYSNDQTPHLALELGATVLNHPISLGYAATLQSGYKYAQQYGYPYLIQLDGDGQHLPSSLPTIYEALTQGDADLILGSRFLHSTPYHPSLPRKMGMKMFSGAVRLFTKIPLSDTTSGFQGMKQTLYEWYTQEHFPRDFPDADILIRTHFQGFRIKEVPAEMRIPLGNISMHRGILRPMYYVLKMWLSILQVFCRYCVWR